MESPFNYQNKPHSALIVRKKRIHKISHKTFVKSHKHSTPLTDLEISAIQSEIQTPSCYKNLTHSSNDKFNTALTFLPSKDFYNKVPCIKQHILQQELMKLFEKKIPDFLEDNINVCKPLMDHMQFGAIRTALDNRSGLFSTLDVNSEPPGIKLTIKKPIDYDYCYIGRATIEKPAENSNIGELKPVLFCTINFNNLKEILLLFFIHKLTEINLCTLNADETTIFRAVLERKNYLLSRNTLLIDFANLPCNNRSNCRRSEEKFKFIIKRIIKYLKKRDKIKTDEEFYNIYFKNISFKLGLSLNGFYDPHNKILKNRHFKSLSTDYVMLLLRSDLFLIELLYYLESHLINDHVRSLDSKVANLCRKWESMYESLDETKKSADTISQLILNTEKGSKLPWSIGEVREAVDLMKNVIYSWNYQRFMR